MKIQIDKYPSSFAEPIEGKQYYIAKIFDGYMRTEYFLNDNTWNASCLYCKYLHGYYTKEEAEERLKIALETK